MMVMTARARAQFGLFGHLFEFTFMGDQFLCFVTPQDVFDYACVLQYDFGLFGCFLGTDISYDREFRLASCSKRKLAGRLQAYLSWS